MTEVKRKEKHCVSGHLAKPWMTAVSSRRHSALSQNMAFSKADVLSHSHFMQSQMNYADVCFCENDKIDKIYIKYKITGRKLINYSEVFQNIYWVNKNVLLFMHIQLNLHGHLSTQRDP